MTTVTFNPAPGAPAATATTAPPDPLARLEAEAAAMEAAATPPDPDARPPVDVHEDARQVVDLAASVLMPILPDRYAVRYGPAQVQAIAQALGNLCEARGWTAGALLGRYAPELAMVVALVGPALPVLMADAKARRQAVTRPAPRPMPQAQPVEAAA
ncbi:MAG: hypothetical protein KBC73_05485 [Burkholderiaceae bacterium]|nr:hypothetical protein [Burkholderiaceae bacterium]